MRIHSIRFKTTVLYSSILLGILVLFSAFVFHSTRRILYQSAEEELLLKAEHIADLVNAYVDVSQGKLPPMSLMKQFLSDQEGEDAVVGQKVIDGLWEKNRWLMGTRRAFFRVIDPAGQVVLQSENLPTGANRILNAYFLAHAADVSFSNLKLNGETFREVRYPFTFAHRTTYILQIAAPLTSLNRTLSRLMFVMAVGILTVLVLSVFIGSFLTRRILKPVEEVTRTANNISQKNLGVRIPEQALDQEMLMLVGSFNQMIDRLERSFTHINEFSSHVAHELKTPLAIIKGELELVLAGGNVKEDGERVMGVALQEINRLIRIIKDLLTLARFEYKLDIFKLEELDLTAFLKDVYQHSCILAAEKKICFTHTLFDQPLMIKGDEVHLRRLFFNLVHNAVKFTPSGGKIELAMTTRARDVWVSVKDSGQGISPKDQSRIFEKFYRVRRADQSEPAGTGLGLCMARLIARGHGGDLTFESVLDQGSIFTVVLPV